MRTVKLLSWHPDLPTKASALARKDLTIDSAPLVRTYGVVGELARLNPAALVLDLDKLPSNSREIALMLRASKSARHIPSSSPENSSPPSPANDVAPRFARPSASWALHIQEVSRESTR